MPVISQCFVLFFSVIRSNVWAAKCRREDLLEKDVLHRYRNNRLCEKHFAPESFLDDTTKHLCQHAIPTVFCHEVTGAKRKLISNNDSENGWYKSLFLLCYF